jgi:hypothetical protein
MSTVGANPAGGKGVIRITRPELVSGGVMPEQSSVPPVVAAAVRAQRNVPDDAVLDAVVVLAIR